MKVFLFDIGNVLCDFDYKNLLYRYKEISNKSVTIDTPEDQQMYNDVEAGKISDQEYVTLVNNSKNIKWTVDDLVYAYARENSYVQTSNRCCRFGYH